MSDPACGFPPYDEALGTPRHWRNETSGILRKAITAYLDNRISGTIITNESLFAVIEYLKYYINAPCWVGLEFFREDIIRLRGQAEQMKTVEEVAQFISDALDISLDPL